MWLLLLPLLIVFGFLFAVGGLLAAVFALVEGPGQIVLFGLGLWLIWHNLGRHGHQRRRRDAQTAGPWYAAAAAAGAASAAHRDVTQNTEKKHSKTSRYADLPSDIRFKVERIERKVEALLLRADRFPPFSQDLYLVRQTGSDYLPRTLEAYRAMSGRGDEGMASNDPGNAHQELNAQLDLLDARLDDIARDLQRQDSDRLAANRRFLEDRFAMRDVPGDGVEPPAAPAEVA